MDSKHLWRDHGGVRGITMRVAALLGIGIGVPTPVVAHPSVSVVRDSRGTLYYSDLTDVWMRLADGTRQIAVRNVHTHELWMAPGDTLYGEDVATVGDGARHRVWKRAPDGRVTDVIPWREGYPDDYGDYSFARDARGRSYGLRRGLRRIDIRNPNGVLVRTVPLGPGQGAVGWLTVTQGGTAFVTVGPDLYRLDPGAERLTVVARDLVERTSAFDFVHDRHALMGLWTDAVGNVNVAVLSGQVVKRVGADGGVTVIARSSGEWSPSGGLVAPDGAVWVLEISSANQVRVRRVGS